MKFHLKKTKTNKTQQKKVSDVSLEHGQVSIIGLFLSFALVLFICVAILSSFLFFPTITANVSIYFHGYKYLAQDLREGSREINTSRMNNTCAQKLIHTLSSVAPCKMKKSE